MRFSQNLTKIEILANFDPNRAFWQISAQIEIFGKFRPKSRFSHISNKIEIFTKFDRNRDFLQISNKNRDFSKTSTKSATGKFRPKSKFYGNFQRKPNFFCKCRQKVFFENFGKMEIFLKSLLSFSRIFLPKSRWS